MTLTRFKTDGRWWFWISLTLFVVPWFLPIWDVKGDAMRPAACWIFLFAHPSQVNQALEVIFMFSLLFGVPAISIGWVLHCIAVMIRDAKRRKSKDAS
jgi:hypothetical protein